MLEGQRRLGCLRPVEGFHGLTMWGPQLTFPPAFFPQGERGLKGACGLDGEKGDKVGGQGVRAAAGPGPEADPLPDAHREMLVPQAVWGWQVAREMR